MHERPASTHVSMSNKAGKIFLLQDIAIIAVSVSFAVLLVKSDVVIRVLASSKELEVLGSFVAGMFFTSMFTTAPAIVTLAEIAHVDSILLTALFGALGAVVGDLIIFRFVQDRFSEHLLQVIQSQGLGRKMKSLVRLQYFRWFTFFVGGLIMASPLPDELGIGLLGFSKIKLPFFILFAFLFNFIGILLIGLIAQAL